MRSKGSCGKIVSIKRRFCPRAGKTALFVCLAVSCLAVGSLTGCGAKENIEELETYKGQMESFFAEVAEIDDAMNAIDTSSDAYGEELLSLLDRLDTAFAEMAEYEIPDEFASIGDLAVEASENMNRAVTLYHDVFGAAETPEPDEASETADGSEVAAYNEAFAPFDENTADAAMQYYERANLRMKYIIQILHGELPEGDNITYTYETEE